MLGQRRVERTEDDERLVEEHGIAELNQRDRITQGVPAHRFVEQRAEHGTVGDPAHDTTGPRLEILRRSVARHTSASPVAAAARGPAFPYPALDASTDRRD